MSEEKIILSPEQISHVINSIKNSRSIQDLLCATIKTTGIEVMSYHHIAGPGTYDYKNMRQHFSYHLPQALEDFLNNFVLTQDDPGVTATFSSGKPVWVSDMLEHELVKGLSNEADVQAFLKLCGDGLLLALFGPEDRKGYAFVSFGKDKVRDQYDPIFEWQVHALLQMLHVHYCLLLVELQKKVKLTKREAEVLELITLGKTNPEIAVVLNITKNTVASYVKRIFLKLETSDRVTAAMRARTINFLS